MHTYLDDLLHGEGLNTEHGHPGLDDFQASGRRLRLLITQL